MTQYDDYESDVSNTEFVDHDVERLITGQRPKDPAFAELTAFVEALRSFRPVAPSTGAQEPLVARAVAIVRSEEEEQPATVPRGFIDRRDRRPSWLPARAAVALGAFVLLIGVSIVAAAAHSAVPGDPLYGIDIALEAMGVGDGSVGERIAESEVLVASGDHERAFILLGETLENAQASGNAIGALQAQERIVVVASVSNGGSAVIKARVERLQRFLAENKEPGVGLDGDEFSRALSEIGTSHP